MPFAVFWMRAHFVNMPTELSEAARVDGASTWDLFWRIHVPLARPPIAVARDPPVGLDLEPVPALAWCSSRTRLQRTMAGALGAYQGHYATNIPLLCAGSILILTPTLIVFLALPAPVHLGAAPGLPEGMSAQRRRHVARLAPRSTRSSTKGSPCEPRPS